MSRVTGVSCLAVAALLTAQGALGQESATEWVRLHGRALPPPSGETSERSVSAPLSISATLTFYTSAATFDAAAPGLPVEDFEAGVGDGVSCPDPLDQFSNIGCFALGSIEPGLQIASNPAAHPFDGLALFGPAFGLPSKRIVANYFVETLNVIFSPGVPAAGMDVNCYLPCVQTFNITVFDTSDVLIGSTTAATGTFWGVTSDTPIGRINLSSQVGDAEAADNIRFGGAPSPCGAFSSVVGNWGPVPGGCGDVSSTASATTYESEADPASYGDFGYEVQLIATRPNQPTASNTLFVRGTPGPLLTSAQRWNSGIAFNFTTNGKFSVFRYNGATVTPLQSWVTPSGTTLNGSGLPNTLRVDATGGTLTFSINGVAVKTVTGQTLLSGQVGIGMVRSIPTTEAGPNDTLVVQSAVVTPSVGVRGSGGPAAGKGVSPEQERANQAANVRNPGPDPYFDSSRK